MPAIGYVTRSEDGSFKGQLKTLSIRAEMSIVAKPRHLKADKPETAQLQLGSSRTAQRGS